jgi:hypothetical protein
MEQWQNLRQNDSHLPSLLVKASFSRNGYSIRLTDLSRIWAEELNKSEIIIRARARNCSIDPGEDTEQYDIFTDKFKSALQQHRKTALTLSTTKNGNLKLHLEAPLPSPLPRFEWEADLKQMSDRSVEADLVSPLLQKACLLERHMQLMIAELQAKDKVIAKITDRLETSGHDLSAVFPGVTNVKTTGNKSKREQFARHVRGLGEFDEDSWSAKLAADKDALKVTDESADAILASLSSMAAEVAEEETQLNWWRKLVDGHHIALVEERSGGADAPKNGNPDYDKSFGNKSDGIDDDDGFQRQATPPRLRTHSDLPTSNDGSTKDAANAGVADGEDSTEDEDDLDGPPSRSKPAPRHALHNNTRAHAAVNNRESSTPPVRNPPEHVATTRGPFSHEEDTEDNDDDLDGPSRVSQKAAPSSQLPSREKSQTLQPSLSSGPSPRKRLGTLGGRARTKSPTPMSITPIEEHEGLIPASPSPAKHKAKAKLGIIGGNKTRPKPDSPASISHEVDTSAPSKKLGTIGGKREVKPSKAATASATPEPQRREARDDHKPDVKAEPAEPEDPVEKANAKRDALKRQLEEKAKAPVKKKRKF